jgi:hypothetical protein
LDPALRGADGLAAAVAAMKPKDIRVVAYLNTLAWQNDEDPIHWLNKHPDWLDVDVLGRGRLEWMKKFGPGPVLPGLSEARYNYVRAAEPQVEARLKALLTALAARKDVAAVAFAAWQPAQMPTIMSQGPLVAPRLGFALRDRVAAFQRTGADPAEVAAYNDYLPKSLRFVGVRPAPPGADAADLHSLLTARLLDTAKGLRPDWRAYLIQDAVDMGQYPDAKAGGGKDAPKPDLTITSVFASDPGPDGSYGALVPVERKTLFDTIAGLEDDPESRAEAQLLATVPPVVQSSLFLARDPTLKARTLPIALYDFRDAPELITDSLKWVKPPGQSVDSSQGPATP